MFSGCKVSIFKLVSVVNTIAKGIRTPEIKETDYLIVKSTFFHT